MNAIISSSSTKAPGPDGLGFECIKMAYRAIPDYFDTLYEVLLRYGYHPKAWREATIVIIKKNGKPDYSAPKAYRPISLLNCLGKISEKIMATRLAHMAEKHHLLQNLQIGGRPKRSAVDAAMFLTTKIDEAKLRAHYNHIETKNHSKFFAKLFSHWLKSPLFWYHPLPYRERSLQ